MHVRKETVEVFKTNVNCEQQAAMLLSILHDYFPGCKINFDLEDCDRVLRVAGQAVVPERIINTLRCNGYQCIIME